MTLRSRSLRIDQDRCQGHMQCMRTCPTQAIRVWGGKAQLLPGRCIDCGLCLRVCPSDAIIPRFDSFTNFARFRHTVAIPSPAVFSQFGRDVAPLGIMTAIRQAGFNEVVDMSAAIEAVLLQLEDAVKGHSGRRPLISPFCPTVVRLIQVRYPDLVETIAPVESPQEVLAAAIREERSKSLGLRRDQIGVVFISPCAAKMADLKLHTHLEPSNLDGVIALGDLYGHVKAALSAKAPAQPPGAIGNGVTGLGLGWVLLGGQGASPQIENSLSVGGLPDVIATLEDIEKGKLRDIDYIECRSCRDGCVDGCLMIENPYEARSKVVQLVRQRGAEFNPTRPAVRVLRERSGLKSKPVVPRPQESLDADMAKAIDKMRRLEDLHGRLPQIDCGACGAPSCRAFSEDVVQGRLEESDCVFLLQGRLRQTVTELSSILDKLPQSESEKREGQP